LITFGPYLPDQPDLNGGTTVALNVLPRTAGSYGPIGALASISDALSTRPYGANAFRASDGNVYTFCGDVQDLFKLTAATWGNVSKSSAAYTVASDDHWEFVKYGEVVIAVNGFTDAPQAYTMGTSTKFADLGGSPPSARHAAVINNFVVLANLSGAVNRLHWSALDDPTDWPTIGSADAAAKQSDRQDLPTGDAIQAITGAIGGSDGAVFCEKTIYRMQYDGPPHVFSILPIEEGRGALGQNSVVNVGPFAFYLGEDGFYRFTGSQSVNIGDQKVDKEFFSDFDTAYPHRVYGVADPINKIVAWAYPGSGNSAGRPNKIIWYNWAIDRWSLAEIDVEYFYSDLAIGSTLDELDTFGNLDTLPASLDSRIWTGGSLVLSAFDTTFKLSRFTGANMAATIETQETEAGSLLNLPNHRMMIDGIRPYVDTDTVSDVTVGLKYRESPGTSLTTDGPNAVDADGEAHFTRSTRYARAQVVIGSGATWTHAQGIDIDAQDDGVL
jgi:hypothetical protein